MTHRFNVVPIGIEDEGRIVVRVIVDAKTGCTIVFSACCHRGDVEGVDCGSSRGTQSNVKAATTQFSTVAYPKGGLVYA